MKAYLFFSFGLVLGTNNLMANDNLVNVVSEEVKILKCPAGQSPEDRANKWRDAFVTARKGADEKYRIDMLPVFQIQGVYINGKVLCDSDTHAKCFAVGNTDMSGKLQKSDKTLVLTLPVGNEVLE